MSPPKKVNLDQRKTRTSMRLGVLASPTNLVCSKDNVPIASVNFNKVLEERGAKYYVLVAQASRWLEVANFQPFNHRVGLPVVVPYPRRI